MSSEGYEKPIFKPGDWVVLAGSKDRFDHVWMLVVGNPKDDLRYDIESVRVFWLDNELRPHRENLPTVSLKLAE